MGVSRDRREARREDRWTCSIPGIVGRRAAEPALKAENIRRPSGMTCNTRCRLMPTTFSGIKASFKRPSFRTRSTKLVMAGALGGGPPLPQ